MIVAVSQYEAIKKNQITPWWFYWGSCLCTLGINAVKRLNFSYSCSFTEYLCILSSQLLMITLYYDKNHHRPQQQLSNEHFIKAFSLITSLKFVIRWHCRINPSSPRAVIRCDYTPQTHCISVQIIAITAVMENTSVFVLLRACKKPGTINQLEIRTLTRHFSLEKKAALCIFQPHKGWLFPVLSFKVIKFKSLIFQWYCNPL